MCGNGVLWAVGCGVRWVKSYDELANDEPHNISSHPCFVPSPLPICMEDTYPRFNQKDNANIKDRDAANHKMVDV
jgi:hypothetical protein